MRSVAIVGRPNVGKSALFNRLAGRMISIVHDQPGVTRDRITARCRMAETPFEIIDTGGIGAEPDPDFAEPTREAAEIAIESADVLLFVVDGQSGLTPLDSDLARQLRASKRPVFLVVNKVDLEQHEPMALDFSRLGFSRVHAVSAAHGRGIPELVAEIEENLPSGEEREAEQLKETPRLALIGRPNVGKSSLINAILDNRRAIVSEIAGTTRDAVDTVCERDGKTYILCDTAGIRHRSKHNTSVEVFSVMRSESAIEGADLCLLVIDATQGVTAQDKKIAGLIQKSRKAAVVILNKWDLIAEGHDPSLLREHVERVRRELFFIDYAPVVVLSALTGENMRRLFTAVEKVRQHASRRAGTGELNRLLRAAMERQPPPMRGSRRFKLLYATQVFSDRPRPFAPAQFLLFVNAPQILPDSYNQYLTARLREKWEYPGVPVLFRLKGREQKAPGARQEEPIPE